MSIQNDWLWDRKINVSKAKTILANPGNKHFLPLAAVLLSRKNTPKEVFKVYLKPLVFIQNWNGIKRRMRKNSWNDPRIDFWQAIYEKLREKYKKNGKIPAQQPIVLSRSGEFCKVIAEKLKAIRKQKGLTQSELAKKLKVSQQMVSRIEKGKENLSLLTLKNIVDKLQAELRLEIV